MTCQDGRYPVARDENITGAFYLLRHLQRLENILFRSLCHHRVVKVAKRFDYPWLMLTVHRIAKDAEGELVAHILYCGVTVYFRSFKTSSSKYFSLSIG